VNGSKLKVALVSSEAVPYAKAGGLGDVIGALPKVLEAHDCEVMLFIPKYSAIPEDAHKIKINWRVDDISIPVGEKNFEVHLYQTTLPGTNTKVNLVYCAHAFDNRWIYTNDPDENQRFIIFNRAVLKILKKMKWKPDVIHVNDWPTGLIPLYLKTFYKDDPFFAETGTVFTIHNIGYPGKFLPETIYLAGLDQTKFFPGGPYEFWGMFSFMKTALLYSDMITTVSETYAEEILTPDYGAGLDGILNTRKEDLIGILNGVDYEIWNPEVDTYLPNTYSLKKFAGKAKVKEYLQERVHLPIKPDVPLIGMISRMVDQKGFDLIAAILPQLLAMDIQIVMLGSGLPKYETLFRTLHQEHPEKVYVHIGYDNQLAHEIEAGSDMFLMPSLYEPCGLNQIYSLKYGTVPIVRKTGGLADTILDWGASLLSGKKNGNGFVFTNPKPEALLDAIHRAVMVYANKKEWTQIVKNGMKADFSWERSASKYIEVYEKAIAKRKIPKTET